MPRLNIQLSHRSGQQVSRNSVEQMPTSAQRQSTPAPISALSIIMQQTRGNTASNLLNSPSNSRSKREFVIGPNR